MLSPFCDALSNTATPDAIALELPLLTALPPASLFAVLVTDGERNSIAGPSDWDCDWD